jgi:hypothetical protein
LLVAMRQELVFMNPARLATLPTAPASHNRPWSADEARRFLTVARNDPLYLAEHTITIDLDGGDTRTIRRTITQPVRSIKAHRLCKAAPG